MNSLPIARFPEHIYINLNEDLIYSLEVFDPDGDIFQCNSLFTMFSKNKDRNQMDYSISTSILDLLPNPF
jgi:hypothetical protein